MLRLLSRFLRALFQFSKRAAGKATKFGRSGVKLLGVVGAARLECGEPAAESGELIRRQLGNSFGNFFDFHGAQLTSSNLFRGIDQSSNERTKSTPKLISGGYMLHPRTLIAAGDGRLVRPDQKWVTPLSGHIFKLSSS